MRLGTLIAIVALLVSVSARTAWAQTPLGTTLTYQGELASGGGPATGLFDVRFRLYDAAEGGHQVGDTLCSAALSIENGRFTVPLDFGPVFNGAKQFLEVEVRESTGSGCADSSGYTTLTPRQELTPAPNANFAQNAATANSAAMATNAATLNGQPASFFSNAANLTGALPSSGLSGTYANALNLSNPGNNLGGNGLAITNLNATNISTGILAAARMPGDWPAGGDLSGFFPNPTIALGAVTLEKLAPGVQDVLSSLGNVPATVTPVDAIAWGRSSDGQLIVPGLPAGVTYTSVAGGGAYSLALRSDGNVVVWGSNFYGQFRVPELPSGMVYTAIAAGADHCLAVRSDGNVVGWGRNNAGQTDVPALPEGVTYIAVAAGLAHSLALRSDGALIAWGDNGVGQTNVPVLPSGVTYTGVAGGGGHTLALRSDGTVVAWGLNNFGQTDVPALPTGVTYTAVTGIGDFSVALRSDGNIVAFGRDISGQTSVPPLPAGVTYTAVVAGGFHCLALRSDGELIAWGENGDGQINVPTLPAGLAYSALGAGYFHSLAIRGNPQASFLDSSTGLRIGAAAPPPATGGISIAGDSTFAGGVSAASFFGNGAGLTNINAVSLTGTVPDSRLSSNIPRLNASNSFTGGLTAPTFTGSGAGLTNLNASNMTTGTVRQSVLPVFAWAAQLPSNGINPTSYTTVGGTSQVFNMRPGVAVVNWSTSAFTTTSGTGFVVRVRAANGGFQRVGAGTIFFFNQNGVHQTISGNAVVETTSGNTTFTLEVVRTSGTGSFNTDFNDSFTASIINIGQ